MLGLYSAIIQYTNPTTSCKVPQTTNIMIKLQALAVVMLQFIIDSQLHGQAAVSNLMIIKTKIDWLTNQVIADGSWKLVNTLDSTRVISLYRIISLDIDRLIELHTHITP